MMAAFNVTALADFGYPETAFRDPMESRWRAEAVAPSKLTPAAITEKVQFMASLQPYNNVEDVLDALDDYWAAHKKREVSAAAPKTRRMRIEGSKMTEVF
jgi:bilirubin oxidase